MPAAGRQMDLSGHVAVVTDSNGGYGLGMAEGIAAGAAYLCDKTQTFHNSDTVSVDSGCTVC